MASLPSPEILDQYGQPIRAQQDTAHFGASRTARELRSWMPPLESADSEMYGERQPLAARAMDLERNNGIAGAAIQTDIDNVVGIGLRLSVRPDYKALGRDKKWATEWARDVESKFRSFANSPDFDAARRLTFGGATAIMLRSALVTGDGLALPLWLGQDKRPGARWKTCFQMVDSARLGTPTGSMESASLRDGIEINDVGEAIAYHFRKAHPGDMYAMGYDHTYVRVPARTEWGRRRVIHLFEQQRPDQTRGKTVLAKVMAAFKMLDHYQRIELQTVVVNSMIAAFIETPLSGEQVAELFGTPEKLNASRAAWDVKLEGASVIPLHPGDKLSSFNPGRPNGAYEKFVNAVLRYIAAGVNKPYELLMKDFSQTNYSSARAALLEAWRYFMARREWLATYWATPVYELWLEEAINDGVVEDPGFYTERAAVLACRWIGPGRGWVDPVKEADAAKIRMEATLSTLEDECAEQGKDWEEVLEQRAHEQAVADELGVPLYTGGRSPDPYPSDVNDNPPNQGPNKTPQSQDAAA